MPPPMSRITRFGFDHGVGHPLLFLCDANVPNYRKNKRFKDLGHYSEWPKVADAVIKAPLLIDCMHSTTCFNPSRLPITAVEGHYPTNGRRSIVPSIASQRRLRSHRRCARRSTGSHSSAGLWGAAEATNPERKSCGEAFNISATSRRCMALCALIPHK